VVSSRSYAALREATQEGDIEVERRAAHQGERREGTWPVVVCPPPWGPLYIVGRWCTLPLPKATKGGHQRKANGGGRPREVGANQPLPTLTLAPSRLGP
jgi:hypothetical protein